VMLTGGADAMLCFGGIKAWEGLRVMSPDGCRPFCATRNGMVMGEGAGVFVFEDMAKARARGADILAEVAGFGMTSDAADIVLPSAEGAARAVRAALADGGLRADQVGYINAHGTGTAANDRTEAGVIAEVFGAARARIIDQGRTRASDRRDGCGGIAGLHHGAARRGDCADAGASGGGCGLCD
jgi:nodulation protein E